jgi:hypothetical protein
MMVLQEVSQRLYYKQRSDEVSWLEEGRRVEDHILDGVPVKEQHQHTS